MERGIACHSELLIHAHVFLKFRFTFRGQCTIDIRILEAGFTRHRERADVSFSCGDGFSRQPLHATHIPVFVHGHVAFDGGLGAFRVPFDTLGPIIGGFDIISILSNVGLILVDSRFVCINLSRQFHIFVFQSSNIIGILANFTF